MSSILDRLAVRNAALPISVAQYHWLGQAGVIAEQTELLKGVIIRKMIKSPKHSWLVQRIAMLIQPKLPNGFHIRQEQPLTFHDSEPEPDLALVEGTIDDYQSDHPSTAQLVIEIAISTTDLDRDKAIPYSEAQVDEYWIILPKEQLVERYFQLRSGIYQRVEQQNLAAAVHFAGPPALEIDLSWIPSIS